MLAEVQAEVDFEDNYETANSQCLKHEYLKVPSSVKEYIIVTFFFLSLHFSSCCLKIS